MQLVRFLKRMHEKGYWEVRYKATDAYGKMTIRTGSKPWNTWQFILELLRLQWVIPNGDLSKKASRKEQR